MLAQLRAAIVSLILFTLITGVAYPLLITGIAQAAMHDKANGSMIVKDGKVVGSKLIGQSFDDPKYFWGRPSAAKYDGASSTGSNFGPTSSALVDEVKGRTDALRAADPDNAAPIPIDLVTSSGSGLDPDISPAAAEYQVRRVARTRGIDEARVETIVAEYTQGRDLGFLGEPRVNVLSLNLALDALR